MKIEKGIKIVDLSLYIEEQKTLVICDLHLGYEELLKKQGYLIPFNQYEDIVSRLKKILDKVEVKRIIINGDLKHEFGEISNSEWKQVMDLLELIGDKEVILVRGNHDNILGPIAGKKNIKIVDKYDINDITITHGHIIPGILNRVLVIGHEHPCVSFPERPDEKYKAFLKGKFEGSTLIVMPSFNFIFPGTDVTREKSLSPFLRKNVSDFEVFVVENKIYRFKNLDSLKLEKI
ncbi:MAG: metallophosphoesterase [Candidatus Nanoarchaeia archaeon]|nr:metallophosphoesterase [Candidatus Nanoarchaeia archaeon]